jgi:hypothetical protein
MEGLGGAFPQRDGPNLQHGQLDGNPSVLQQLLKHGPAILIPIWVFRWLATQDSSPSHRVAGST